MAKRTVTVRMGSIGPDTQEVTIPISERKNVTSKVTIGALTDQYTETQGQTFTVVSDPKGPAAGN